MSMEPAYSFTIPSIEDDTPLDCRLYQPANLYLPGSNERHVKHELCGAVIAHPYAPLGGCYDDPVVLSITRALVQAGYIVATFNFRGAATSAGSTSWTGKGEKDDYMTVAGFMTYFLQNLSNYNKETSSYAAIADAPPQQTPAGFQLLLAGYSYGSLILSRLLPLRSIIQRFEAAAWGTSDAEVILRARRLATETTRSAKISILDSRGRPESPRSLPSSPSGRFRAHSMTIRLGGEETQASERRLSRSSRDARRGLDIVKKSVEVPHRIRMHLRRRSSSKSVDERSEKHEDIKTEDLPAVMVRYLLISPLLPPLSHALVPSAHLTKILGNQPELKDPSTGFGSLESPTMLVWGSQDGFTSSKKLTTWALKLADLATGPIQSNAIEGAGHFWREPLVLRQLLQHIAAWNKVYDDRTRTSDVQ